MSKKALFVGVGIVATLFIGVGIGAGSRSAADPTPAVTITSEPVVKTETVTKVEVPKACLSALDDADGLTKISADMANLFVDQVTLQQDIVTAWSESDYSKLDSFAARQATIASTAGDLTDRVTASSYTTNRDACRAAS